MSMLPQLRTRASHLRTPHLRPARRTLAVAPAPLAADGHVVDSAVYVDGRPVPAGTRSGSTCSSARCWSCAGR